jgi:hypothetical protein
MMAPLLTLQVAASGVMDLVLSFAKSKEEKGLKKGDGAKRSRLVGASSWVPEWWRGTKHRLLSQQGRQEPALPRCSPPLPASSTELSDQYLPLCTGIAKLDDANDAGTKHSRDCTLILTEGDSAKTLAVAGLSVVGRDRFGVFPLR